MIFGEGTDAMTVALKVVADQLIDAIPVPAVRLPGQGAHLRLPAARGTRTVPRRRQAGLAVEHRSLWMPTAVLTFSVVPEHHASSSSRASASSGSSYSAESPTAGGAAGNEREDFIALFSPGYVRGAPSSEMHPARHSFVDRRRLCMTRDFGVSCSSHAGACTPPPHMYHSSTSSSVRAECMSICLLALPPPSLWVSPPCFSVSERVSYTLKSHSSLC